MLVIVGFSLYAAREIRTLRDEQAATSERNRLDTLQIVRIQQNLSSVAGALRDMLGGTEPYPLAAWANTFARLRIDLEQALARERELAPAGRLTAEQARLDEANGRFWEAVDRAFATATANGGGPAAESAGAAIIRGEASARHAELVTLVSQLVIHNTRMDEASAARGRDVYDQVARQIYLLAAVLVAGVVVGGAILLRNTRRTFETVQGLAAERRALSWRMLTHAGDAADRVRPRAARRVRPDPHRHRHDARPGPPQGDVHGSRRPSMAPFVADLEEAQQVTQRTLDRVRTKSRLLHPVILDDFGLQQAVAWYTDEFARQHGIDTRFEPDGDLAGLPPDVADASLSHRPGIADQRRPARRGVAGAGALDPRRRRHRADRRRRRQGPAAAQPGARAERGPGRHRHHQHAGAGGADGRHVRGRPRSPRRPARRRLGAAGAAAAPSRAPSPARTRARRRIARIRTERSTLTTPWLKDRASASSCRTITPSCARASGASSRTSPASPSSAEGGTGAQAVELAKTHKPDVVVLDMAMPDMNGVQAARMILRERPQTRVLILSMYADEQYVRSALDAGVAGYILKNALDNDLTRAVRAVAAGQQYLSPELSAIVIKALQGKGESDDPWDQLTEREKQVLQLIAHGKSNKEIAVVLGLSVNTVAVHRANLMSTLKVHKAAELVLYAVKKGLVVTG